MSFLKIADPAQRDHIVQDFLKTRANIQQNLLSERLSDIGLQRELTKWCKPITDVGKSQLAEQQVLSIALQERPSIVFPRYPSIQAKTDDEPEESLTILGPTATHYLRSMASKVPTDKTFGLRDEDGKFFIGDSEGTIADDDIVIRDSKLGAFLPNPGFGFGKPPNPGFGSGSGLGRRRPHASKIASEICVYGWYILINAVKY